MTKSIKDLFDLTGKGAIVTGGGIGGIGEGIALRLAEAGAGVLVVDVNLENAEKTVQKIVQSGGKAKAIKADVISIADAQRVAESAVSSFGNLTILVNNAGIYPMTPIQNIDETIWDKVLDINLKGLFFYSKYAAEQMIKAGKGGRIINIASMDAFHPNGYLAHYDSSKGGVVSLTRAQAKEYAPHNILANAIAPGGISTAGATGAAPPEVMKAFIETRVPLKRMGIPDDIATAVLFLASDASSYMTGQTVIIDGGYLLS